jgi:hypothetical protein
LPVRQVVPERGVILEGEVTPEGGIIPGEAIIVACVLLHEEGVILTVRELPIFECLVPHVEFIVEGSVIIIE